MMANETSSTDITDRLFGFLVDFNLATQQYEPGIAKSWEVTPDGITWTFHLRKGAAFSDGHPITAEDVLFSFEVVYDETLHPAMQDMLQIGGQNFQVTAPDPHTVVINTGKPHAGLLDALCPGNLPIIPKHVLGDGLQERDVRGSLQRQHAAGEGRDERRLAVEPARDEREDRARPQSVSLRVRSEQAAAAVPRRARLPRRAGSGCGRSEIPFGWYRRRGRCEAGELPVVRGKPGEGELHAV